MQQQLKKPWKSLWEWDAIWNLHCSLLRACLVGWTGEGDQSPAQSAFNIRKHHKPQAKPSRAPKADVIDLSALSPSLSLSFPPSVGKSGLKLLSLPAAEWCGQGAPARPGWWMCWWWEGKERKILMRKGLKIWQSCCRAQGGLCLAQG